MTTTQEALNKTEVFQRAYERLIEGKIGTAQFFNIAWQAAIAASSAEAQPSQEPVYYSITVNGQHCSNFWPNRKEAEEAAKRLNASYPQDSRAVVPLYTHPQPSAPVAQEGWKIVAEHGNPQEGVYVAIYEDGDAMPVAMLIYGDYEYYTDDTSKGDDEGMVRGFGWHEIEITPSDDSYTYLRKVLAYLPTNYDTAALNEVRAILASSQKEGEQPK